MATFAQLHDGSHEYDISQIQSLIFCRNFEKSTLFRKC